MSDRSSPRKVASAAVRAAGIFAYIATGGALSSCDRMDVSSRDRYAITSADGLSDSTHESSLYSLDGHKGTGTLIEGESCVGSVYSCAPWLKCAPGVRSGGVSEDESCRLIGESQTREPCSTTEECHASSLCIFNACYEFWTPPTYGTNGKQVCREFGSFFQDATGVCLARCDPLAPFNCRGGDSCHFAAGGTSTFVCTSAVVWPGSEPPAVGQPCVDGCAEGAICTAADVLGGACSSPSCCTRICDLSLPEPDAACEALQLGIDHCVPMYGGASEPRAPEDEWEARLGRCLASP